MQNAKLISLILAGMAGLILTSYTTLYAYEYFTTTTFSEVQRAREEYQRSLDEAKEKKSKEESLLSEYCYDARLSEEDCKSKQKELSDQKVESGTGTLAPTPSEPPLGIKKSKTHDSLSVPNADVKQVTITPILSVSSVNIVKKLKNENWPSYETISPSKEISTYHISEPKEDPCTEWKSEPKTVVLHYTFTETDTVKSIANGHKARFGVDHYIAYHYVIKKDGEIVSTRPESCASIAVKDETMNKEAIHIAYIGKGKPNEKQLASLVSLTRDVQAKYSMSRDDVTAHADIQAKNWQESMEGMFGSKAEFIKLMRQLDKITIYGKSSPELTYLWHAWGDLDLIGTWYQESRISHASVGDGGDAHGYCQINKAQNPGWFKEYKALKTMEERLNYCHELYVYSQGKGKGVGGTFHGWYGREKHVKNISIN